MSGDKVVAGPDKIKALDMSKWVAAAISVLVGMFLYYEQFIEYEFVYRLLAIVPCLLIAGYLAFSTSIGNRFYSLSAEAINEGKKVVWPTKSETNQTTISVLVVVIASGFVLWLIDVILNWLTSIVVG